MRSIVTELCDRSRLTVPEDMTKWRVGPDELDEQLNTLACSHAREFQPDTVQTGDSVRLSCPGRPNDVLLFPGLGLPGAEDAERAVIGLHVGDALTAPICGAAQTMTVQEIRRRAPAAIDDGLIQAEHIEGVATIEDYRRWYQTKTEEENKANAAKNIAFFLMDEIRDHSKYALDQAEVDAWCDRRARECFDECIAMGEDPHSPDEGFELLTDEQAIEKLKGEVLPEFKTILVGEKLCADNGVSVAWEDVREEFEQYMPPDQEGVTEEEWEQAKAEFLENAPTIKAFDLLREEAKRYLEG